MPVSPFSFRLKKPFLKQKLVKQINPSLALHSLLVRSGRLKRKVKVDVYLPFPFRPYSKTYKCLLLNDGQDAEQLKLIDTLTEFYQNGEKFVVVAVHAGDRAVQPGPQLLPRDCRVFGRHAPQGRARQQPSRNSQ